MRNFKFRAWDPKVMKMYYGLEHMPTSIKTWRTESPKAKVMQWTGMQDTNGRDIYEGDYVTYLAEEGKKRYELIQWHDQSFNVPYGYVMEVTSNLYEIPNMTEIPK